jgi:hypothetical protein
MHELIQSNRLDYSQSLKLELFLRGPFKQVWEFESHYKLGQFLQIVKLFRMREQYEMNKPQLYQSADHQEYSKQQRIENQLHLIPPSIQSKLFQTSRESPSNNQDASQSPRLSHQLLSKEIPIKIKLVTWNMARESQEPDWDLLFPNPEEDNIIVFGAQECEKNEK